MSKIKLTSIKNDATEGERLKYVRELLKLSLTDFAAPLGKHLSAVQKWEVNGRKLDKSNLLLLEKVWSINPEFIRSGCGEPFLKANGSESATWLVYDILDKPYAGSLDLKELLPIETVFHSFSGNVGNLLFVKATTGKIPGVLKDDVIGIKLETEYPLKNRTEGQYLLVYKNYIMLKYLCFLDGGIVSVENSLKSPINISLSLLQKEEISIMGHALTIRRNFS